MLTAEVNAIENGDYSFINFGSGVANAEDNDIINNRYVVRDAVASAMGDTLAPDALGRIAAGFSDENGNADLGAFIDSMVNHYAENGNMGEYASLFTDGGASVADVINRTRSEINEKIQHSGSVQGRSVRDSENMGRRAGEHSPESGEGIQGGTGRTEETAYAGRTAEQEVGGVRYNEISQDDWSAEMEQLAQENSDKYGVETVYFAGEAVNDAGDKADAFYYDGVLYLQIDGEHDIRTLRDHEVTHHQEGTEAHDVFKESVKKKLGKEKYDELFRRYTEKYNKTLAKVIEKAQEESGGTLTDDELNRIAKDYIDDEIAANICAGTNEYAELCAEEVATFKNAIENKAQTKAEVKSDTDGKAENKPGEYKNEIDTGGNTSNANVKFALSQNASSEVRQAISSKEYDKEIKLTDSSPAILTCQKGVRNLPMMMIASHVRQNILTEAEARKLGLKVNSNTHYHGLGDKLFLKVIEGLDDVTEAYRGTKNAEKAERRENYFLLISKYTDSKGNTINVPVYINEHGIYNRIFIDTNKIATVFGRDGFREYIKNQIASGNLVRIKNRSNQTSESQSLINSDYSKVTSNNRISQNDSSVNSNSMQKAEKDAQGGTNDSKDVRFNLSGESFDEQVDKILSEKTSDGNHAYVGETTSILRQVGLDDLPMLITKGHIRDMYHEKVEGQSKYHGLPETIIKKIPHMLNYPVLIFDSLRYDDRVCVLTNEFDSDGNPIVIAIKPNGVGKFNDVKVETNFVLTAYGKDGAQALIADLNNNIDNVLFINKIKTQELIKGARLQLPARLNNLKSNFIIHKSNAVVNAKRKELKFSILDSDPYSTQKIIEAKALATDDSEFIEATKENTKQVQRYVRMNSDLQKRLENAKRQMTKSKAPQVNKFEVAKVVKEIIADLEGTVKAADLKDEITDIYNNYYLDIKKAGRVEGKVQEANDRLAERLNVVATKIITSAETTVEHEGYVLLKEWLKETAIKVPDDAKAEAEYSAVRKANYGTLNLTNDGLPIDMAYQELCELYPEWFSDKVTAPADQLKKIVEVLDGVKPDVYNPYAQDMADGIEYAVYRLVSALDGISVMPDTKADKVAKKAASDKAKAVEKARKTFEDKMSKQKEKSDAQIAKLREQLSAAKYVRYWEQRLSNEERVQSIKEIREKRKMATLKAGIRKIVSDLNRCLDKSEKAGGYPKELVSAVAEVCAAVDFHTGLPGKDGGESKASIKLNELKAKYEDLKSGVYEEYRDEYSEVLNDHINKLINSVGGKRVNELTLEELENLETILSEIKHRLVTAKKQIGIDKAKANSDIGREVMADWAKNDDLISAEKNRLAKAFRSGTAGAKAFLFNPHRINEMLAGYDEDSAWWSIYDQLRRGARKAAKFTMDATKPFDELTSGNGGNEVAYYKFRTELIDSGITDTKGNRVKLTKAIMCELVMAWERGQGRKHLENGGFKIPDIKMYNKGKTTVAMNEAATRTRPVTQADITRIKGMLDSYDLEWIAAAKNLFDNVSKKAINETSMQLLGREVAKEKNYIRLHTDTDFVKTDIDGLKVDATLEGAGSLKSVVENAMQPIILRGLSDNVYEQIDFAAKYSGLAIPIRNFSKVYNVSTMDEFGNRESVKETLGKKFGSKIQKDVVEGMVRELQSPRDKSHSAFGGVRGKWLTATFWGNVRSMLKQTTSYCTASSILSESSLAKGLAVYAKVGNRLTSEEVSKHTGSLYKREQGLSTTELGERAERKRVVTDSMFAKGVNKFAPWLKKIPEGLRPGNWLQAMDCSVASALWQACKAEVRDVQNISEDAEGFYCLVI